MIPHILILEADTHLVSEVQSKTIKKQILGVVILILKLILRKIKRPLISSFNTKNNITLLVKLLYNYNYTDLSILELVILGVVIVGSGEVVHHQSYLLLVL